MAPLVYVVEYNVAEDCVSLFTLLHCSVPFEYSSKANPTQRSEENVTYY